MLRTTLRGSGGMTLAIGRRGFYVQAGRDSLLRVHLTKRVRAMLAHHPTLRVSAAASVVDASHSNGAAIFRCGRPGRRASAESRKPKAESRGREAPAFNPCRTAFRPLGRRAAGRPGAAAEAVGLRVRRGRRADHAPFESIRCICSDALRFAGAPFVVAGSKPGS